VKFLVSQRYRHPELGVIHIVVRANAHRFIARWKNDELVVTVPEYTTSDAYNNALANMMTGIKNSKPACRYFYVGWTFDTPLHHFEVVRGTDNVAYRDVDYDNSIITFRMPADTPDEGSLVFNRFVNASLEEYARIFADSLLIPEAWSLANEFGLIPKSFSISRGTRVLGKCYADGRIELSRNLIFYPADHRRYVYAHELAHLTHMDHSPAFHALLDKYLDGREKELKHASDTFVIPIIK